MPEPPVVLSPRVVGGLNRARVLRELIDHGPQSRSELARVAGVTRATIGSIVQGLLDDGVLEELEPTDAGGVGKPARPLWFPAGSGTVIAVDLQPTKVRASLVDAPGHLQDLVSVPVADASSPGDVLGAVQRAVAGVVRTRATLGVGIVVPGTCDPESGEIFGSTQLPGAVGRVLVDRVAAITSLPTLVENDSRAQALAEQWFGLGRANPTFVSLQTGGGIGAGIVLDGRVYRGRNGAAGEVGHQTVVVGGELCGCGQRGCWETIATLVWLRREAEDLGLPEPATVDCARLAELAGEGDSSAVSLLDRYADNLGVGIANLNLILGVERFILHGDAVGGGEAFRQRVEGAANLRTYGGLSVAFTQLDDRVSLLGAAATVLGVKLHSTR